MTIRDPIPKPGQVGYLRYRQEHSGSPRVQTYGTPAEILALWLKGPPPVGQRKLARKMGADPMTVNHILHGRRTLSPKVALQLEKATGIKAELWLAAQARVDLHKARYDFARELADIRRIVP